MHARMVLGVGKGVPSSFQSCPCRGLHCSTTGTINQYKGEMIDQCVCVCVCAGTDFVADDQVVVIMTGSGEIPGCISIESLVDRELEGDEILTVVADVTTNADLVEFPDGDRIDITITDISGESVSVCVCCVCVCVLFVCVRVLVVGGIYVSEKWLLLVLLILPLIHPLGIE